MPPRSKVATLPQEVKSWLDAALVENNFAGYRALADDLKERGYEISPSAIHRYGQEFEERLAALKLATEQARTIVEAVPDDEGASNDALGRLVQEKLFNQLLKGGDHLEKQLPKLAHAIADLNRASVAQKKWQTEYRNKVAAAADKVTKIAQKNGLSSEAVQQMYKAITGIADD